MRVTIYGGSFSPIHKGHIALASQIIKEDMADEVWLMVSPHNPLKSTNDLWPVDLRLKLCEKAVEGLEKIKVSDLETRLEKPSYTYKTLRELSRLHPPKSSSQYSSVPTTGPASTVGHTTRKS